MKHLNHSVLFFSHATGMLFCWSLPTQRATGIYNLGFYSQNKVNLIEDDSGENKQTLTVISDAKTVKQHSVLKCSWSSRLRS